MAGARTTASGSSHRARPMLLLGAAGLFGCLAVAVPALGAQGSNSPVQSTPEELDLWAGSSNWSALTIELPDSGPNVRIAFELLNPDGSDPANPDKQLDSYEVSVHNLTVIPTNVSIDHRLVIRNTLMWLSSVPPIRLTLYLSVDWRYNYSENARLGLVVYNDSANVVIGYKTSTTLHIHPRVVWPQEPRLWSERWGDYQGGWWVNKSTTMHLEASWPVYEGTDEPAPRVGAIWQIGFSGGETSTESPAADPLGRHVTLTFANHSGTEGHRLSLDPFAFTSPSDPRYALVRSWNILVDDDSPYAEAVYPPPGTLTPAGLPTASIGMRACDDHSGIALGVDAAVIEEATGRAPPSIAGHVDRRDVGSPCVDILFELEPPPGISNWTITLHDAVGNTVRVGNLLFLKTPDPISFSNSTPTGPLPVLGIVATVTARAYDGARLDLSSIEWSLTEGPGEPRVWNALGTSGFEPSAVLTISLSLPRSEVYYLQWSASIEGSTERVRSPLYVVTGDTEPPFASNLTCAPSSGGPTRVSVVLGDNTTFVNWNSSYLIVERGGAEEARLPIGAFVELDAVSRTVTFDAAHGEGPYRLRVVAHDGVGNPLADTSCEVVGVAAPPPPPPSPLGAQGGDLWLLVVVILVGAAALLIASTRRRARGRTDD